MKCTAIILSGGTGSRMNMDIPKQYIEVCDRMIITESIRPFLECELVSDIRIVADAMWHDKIIEEYKILSEQYTGALGFDMTDYGSGVSPFYGIYKFSGFSKPGSNRQLSILNALRDIVEDYDMRCSINNNMNYCDVYDTDMNAGIINVEKDFSVIIHDAARPLVSVDLIRRCINALDGHDGVMPVLPMKDTIYYSEDGNGINKLLERDKIYAGQAPEVFCFEKYLKACEELLPDKIMEIKGSTEPAVIAGLDMVMVSGDEMNFKITTKEDLQRYRRCMG